MLLSGEIMGEIRELMQDAVDAPKLREALADIYQYLRGQSKHANPPDDIHDIYHVFWQILEDNGVNLDG